jgi:acyl CoA:acetate/3-ketoacid CoA transferase alpha subunit
MEPEVRASTAELTKNRGEFAIDLIESAKIVEALRASGIDLPATLARAGTDGGPTAPVGIGPGA